MLPTFIGLGATAGRDDLGVQLSRTAPRGVHERRRRSCISSTRTTSADSTGTASQFAAAGAAIARGEISPDYMYSREALANIARDLPGVRVFAILRNPVDRALSAYALRQERNEGLTFGDACRRFPGLINRGLYCRHLDVIGEYFPADRVKVLLYDDLVTRPGAFLDELYEFIGVPTGIRPAAMGTRYNRVIYPGLQKALLECASDGSSKPSSARLQGRGSGDETAWRDARAVSRPLRISNISGRRAPTTSGSSRVGWVVTSATGWTEQSGPCRLAHRSCCSACRGRVRPGSARSSTVIRRCSTVTSPIRGSV